MTQEQAIEAARVNLRIWNEALSHCFPPPIRCIFRQGESCFMGHIQRISEDDEEIALVSKSRLIYPEVADEMLWLCQDALDLGVADGDFSGDYYVMRVVGENVLVGLTTTQRRLADTQELPLQDQRGPVHFITAKSVAGN